MKTAIRKTAGNILTAALLSICATAQCADDAAQPRLITSGRITESGQYAEVGVEFNTWGDFIALISPTRWKSPLATGGSLSWMNPAAWSEDASRTGRILLGEAVAFGGMAAAFGGGGGGGGGGDAGSGSTGPSTPATEPPAPPPPPSVPTGL